jgi:hypothetical protein
MRHPNRPQLRCAPPDAANPAIGDSAVPVVEERVLQAALPGCAQQKFQDCSFKNLAQQFETTGTFAS